MDKTILLDEDDVVECEVCGSPDVTHAAVGKDKSPTYPHNFFCRAHAFTDGRQMCSCCENFSGSEITVRIGETEIFLKPTYEPGGLDRDGMCCEHP